MTLVQTNSVPSPAPQQLEQHDDSLELAIEEALEMVNEAENSDSKFNELFDHDDFWNQCAATPIEEEKPTTAVATDGPADSTADMSMPLVDLPDGQGMFFSQLKDEQATTPTSVPLSLMDSCQDATDTGLYWQTIFEDYKQLLSSKGSLPGRKFNKAALDLLDKCVVLAQTTSPHNNWNGKCSSAFFPVTTPPQNEKASTYDMTMDGALEEFVEFRSLLLNAKEMASEELVAKVVAHVEKQLSPLLTAEERKEELQKKSLAFVTSLSPQMSIKTAPVIKSYIARQFGSDIDDLLAQVQMPEMSLRDKTNIYTRMFENFIDDENSVSFAATNRQLLGGLAPADVWFLTFFAFVTVRRSRGDNLLMLGLVGKLHFKQRRFVECPCSF